MTNEIKESDINVNEIGQIIIDNIDINNKCTINAIDLFKTIKTLNDKLTDLQDRINKAIEYCDREIGNIIANFEYIDTADLENVRKILKGE